MQTQRRRFRRQLREAALRSTDREAAELERVADAVRTGVIPLVEGSECVRALIRDQHARQAA